jgi:glycosyltransferase involved in cell wall biosynthesis
MNLRIAQLSKADRGGGGASRVAEELAVALYKAGHDVTHYASRAQNFNGFCRPLYGQNCLMRTAIRKANTLLRLTGLAEITPFELLPLKISNISRFDLLHFHDLSSAISPFTLFWLSRRQPVVWTLHDCSPFTGGCLYPMDCMRYKDSCGSCPQIGTWPLDSIFDGTRVMHAIKRMLHASNRVQCIAPSEWMARMAFESGKFLAEPLVLTNGVDTDVYAPVADRIAKRRSLGLPDDGPMLLISAGHLRDPRKGVNVALDAIRAISEFKPWVLLMGATTKQDECLFDGLKWIATGYVSDPDLAASYYACVDYFLFCSLADNQPLAVLESLSCGTPVIGFANGGISELVPNNQCGCLVPTNDIDSLVKTLRLALRGEIGHHWRIQARKRIVENHSMQIHLQAHLYLYESLVEQHRA